MHMRTRLSCFFFFPSISRIGGPDHFAQNLEMRQELNNPVFIFSAQFLSLSASVVSVLFRIVSVFSFSVYSTNKGIGLCVPTFLVGSVAHVDDGSNGVEGKLK